MTLAITIAIGVVIGFIVLPYIRLVLEFLLRVPIITWWLIRAPYDLVKAKNWKWLAVCFVLYFFVLGTLYNILSSLV